MKRKKITIYALMILVFIISIACQATTFGKSPTATVDLNATVNAAVAATENAETMIKTTVDSAVLATITAMPPHPSPTPVNSDDLSEEDLADEVNNAVTEANNASQQSSNYTDQATSDNTLTYQEAYEMAYYYGLSQAEIEEALYLAELYLSLYYELAEDTVELLTIVVEDLEQLASTTSEALNSVENIIQVLEDGQIIDTELIKSLSDYNDLIGNQIIDLDIKSNEWIDTLKGSFELRASEFINLEANQIAGDRIGALNIARDYINSINSSLSDGILSREELFSIAQLGANASASINQFGGPQLNNISGNINNLTGQLARGQLPQAKSSVGELSNLIPRR